MKRLLCFSIALILSVSLAIPHTIAVTKKFKDIPTNHWAKVDIDYLASKNIDTGFSDGTYKPNNSVTRAEAAILIGKASNIDTKNLTEIHFSDVKINDVAYPYIAALVDAGVFSPADKFNPNAVLTRSQMAKILVEAFGLQGKTSKVFKDVPKNHWAYPYVTALVANGITTGKTKTIFDTDAKITRGQMAVFLKRSMDYQAVVAVLPIAQEILKLVNIERAKIKSPALKLNMEATKVAIIKAQDFHDNNYFAHVSPTYGDPREMLTHFGVEFKNAAENIAKNQQSAQEVVSDWMASPGHRANILDPYPNEIGIGYAKGVNGTYFVQMFIKK
jgi:uncharacterized YkwD family protein